MNLQERIEKLEKKLAEMKAEANVHKHTEGPWVVCQEDGDSRAFTIFAESDLVDGRISAEDWFGGNYICEAGLNYPNFEANARLIASAPDLLEVLIECDEAMAHMSEYDIPIMLPERVKAAITKARGE